MDFNSRYGLVLLLLDFWVDAKNYSDNNFIVPIIGWLVVETQNVWMGDSLWSFYFTDRPVSISNVVS